MRTIKLQVLRTIGVLVSICASFFGFAGVVSAAPPVIEGFTTTTPRGGGWLFSGETVTVKVDTDANGYTVQCDFSSVPPFGTQKLVTATANGDTTYTCTHTVPSTVTDMGGGMVALTARNAGNEVTTKQPTFPTDPNEMPDFSQAPMVMVNVNPKKMTPPSGTKFTMGSDTTDFATITNFKNATVTFHILIDGKDHAKFTFTGIDMTDLRTLKNMFEVFKLITASVHGKFQFDPNSQSILKNAKASMTLYGLKDTYISAPDILVDGKPDSSLSVTYDAAAGTVTFNAPHFSEFTAVPKITIDSPKDGASVAASKVTVTGSVSDPKATVTIKVNDKDQGTVTVGSDGKFSKEVTLTKKSNTITVDASNTLGSAVQQKLTVTSSVLPETGTPTTAVALFGLATLLGLVLIGAGLRHKTR